MALRVPAALGMGFSLLFSAMVSEPGYAQNASPSSLVQGLKVSSGSCASNLPFSCDQILMNLRSGKFVVIEPSHIADSRNDPFLRDRFSGCRFAPDSRDRVFPKDGARDPLYLALSYGINLQDFIPYGPFRIYRLPEAAGVSEIIAARGYVPARKPNRAEAFYLTHAPGPCDTKVIDMLGAPSDPPFDDAWAGIVRLDSNYYVLTIDGDCNTCREKSVDLRKIEKGDGVNVAGFRIE
jgi:hypothetical protein